MTAELPLTEAVVFEDASRVFKMLEENAFIWMRNAEW